MNLDNLPVEWSVSQLTKMIASEGLISDGDWIESKDQDEKGDIRLIQLADIGDGDFRDKSNRYMNQDAFDRLNCVELKANDVLIARMPDPLGRACIFPKLPYKCVTVVDVCLIRTGERSAISPKLLKYWINSTQIRNLIALNATGTTRKRITRKKLESFDFPVPPLAEQQEIVRQLDVMLAQVEQIKARLDAIPALLKKFRQSVLAEAVSGKLTEGANCSKWIKSTIGAEFKCIDGDRGKNYPKKEDYQTEGYCLFLSTKNVRKFGFLFDDKVFISKQKHEQLRNGTLERDDLIITTRGTLGHIASYDKNVPFDVVRINSGMLILRKTKQNLLNEFMMLLLASPKFQRIIEEQRTGSAQPQLPAKILKEFEIELPSLDEQKLIVQKVESYFELIEKTEETVQSAQKRVNLLTQSILAKAFSGELTAEWREQHQDLITGVNSAEALLAKIQAEREASKPVKKTRAKKEA
ncbi:restriction endonuclease subunit S [Acinetobacter johnsonii]|uniref:restriction endonuclease subunit S n=1 Tax=Acinetobacter johnsonii TaxID=40214 RepID=UPI000E0CBB36|nr:restriction endonuclease subunit S [Acinetobacter johnsonii]MDN5690186.1 restriction endonuclease subunit S [Acinetobacter sp.]WQE03073.1 restriction endonuclease subunit S [Acinetobacter johnsonii]